MVSTRIKARTAGALVVVTLFVLHSAWVGSSADTTGSEYASEPAGGRSLLSVDEGGFGRRLGGGRAATAECPRLEEWELNGGVVVWILVLLYVFVGLAIICDDFFVAALEQISDHLKLSEDVAGATFMAAGSSAPELFVSMADNVLAEPGKTIGVGTIVGSAIFNILIIIAVTAALAGQVLELDWKPLARDSFWYSIAIAELLIFTMDEKITTLEAAIFVLSYVGYLVWMVYNKRIFDWMDDKFPNMAIDRDAQAAAEQAAAGGGAAKALAASSTDLAIIANRTAAFDADTTASRFNSGAGGAGKGAHAITVDVSSFAPSSTGPGSGDPLAAVKRRNSDPAIVAPNELSATVGSAMVRNPLLRSKYRAFTHRRRAGHKMTFLGGATGSAAAVVAGGGGAAGGDAAAAGSAVVAAGSLDKSLAAVAEGAAGGDDDDDEELGNYWDPVCDVPASCAGKLWFFGVWPWYLLFKLTIPDCRFEKFTNPRGFWSCFTMSIVWIGAQCFAITYFVERVGCIFHAPHSLMALTVVAAGTSVPDALASVLVARSGQGDMAVSNAIGSNVFDIMLGCGIPFFISTLVYEKDVPVKTDKLLASIYILFGIVVAVVGTIHCSGWKLTPRVGVILFLMYFAYVIFAYAYGLS